VFIRVEIWFRDPARASSLTAPLKSPQDFCFHSSNTTPQLPAQSSSCQPPPPSRPLYHFRNDLFTNLVLNRLIIMNVITPLNMSHLIHSDAPLSPLSDWEHAQQYSPTSLEFPPSLHYGYAAPLPSPTRSVGSTSSGSPIPVSRVLRGRMSPEDFEPEQQLCLPTHQVFDMTYAPEQDVFSSSPESVQESLPPMQQAVPRVVPCKRPSSVAPSASKKPRASVSTKDFIPPDVTGLSKREARLVKNRAAAFLSRQRKREEFETMEQ
jgi:hypothetical protein